MTFTRKPAEPYFIGGASPLKQLPEDTSGLSINPAMPFRPRIRFQALSRPCYDKNYFVSFICIIEDCLFHASFFQNQAEPETHLLDFGPEVIQVLFPFSGLANIEDFRFASILSLIFIAYFKLSLSKNLSEITSSTVFLPLSISFAFRVLLLPQRLSLTSVSQIRPRKKKPCVVSSINLYLQHIIPQPYISATNYIVLCTLPRRKIPGKGKRSRCGGHTRRTRSFPAP